jgi:hypothetical protein
MAFKKKEKASSDANVPVAFASLMRFCGQVSFLLYPPCFPSPHARPRPSTLLVPLTVAFTQSLAMTTLSLTMIALFTTFRNSELIASDPPGIVNSDIDGSLIGTRN